MKRSIQHDHAGKIGWDVWCKLRRMSVAVWACHCRATLSLLHDPP